MTREIEIRGMWPHAKECWQPPELGRVKEWILLRAPETSAALDCCPVKMI